MKHYSASIKIGTNRATVVNIIAKDLRMASAEAKRYGKLILITREKQKINF
jgi:hypothetical protein